MAKGVCRVASAIGVWPIRLKLEDCDFRYQWEMLLAENYATVLDLEHKGSSAIRGISLVSELE